MADYNMFQTRTMLPALEQMYEPEQFLLNTFFNRTTTVETATVDIDFFKGKRRTAAYVRPSQQGQVLSRLGFETFSYKPPYIKVKQPTTAEQFLNRTYGQTIYQGESPMQRAERQLAIDMADMRNTIRRAQELQCAQGLFTGRISLLDGNDLVFPQSPTHQITDLAYLWTDKVNSKPIDDLRAWKRMVAKDSGIVPDTVILGFDVVTAFLNHPQISDNTGALSMVKVDRGQIKPELKPEGVTYIGYISEIGCDIYSYDSYYVPADAPDDSEALPMVPNDALMMGSTAARMDTIYGPILDMEALQAVAIWPKSWLEHDPSVRWLMLQSSPLEIPTQVDSYMFAEVV